MTSDGWWQDRVVTWEIQALAVLIGGAVAGYNTANGLKQGLYVGLLASAFLMVVLFNFSLRHAGNRRPDRVQLLLPLRRRRLVLRPALPAGRPGEVPPPSAAPLS